MGGGGGGGLPEGKREVVVREGVEEVWVEEIGEFPGGEGGARGFWCCGRGGGGGGGGGEGRWDLEGVWDADAGWLEGRPEKGRAEGGGGDACAVMLAIYAQ